MSTSTNDLLTKVEMALWLGDKRAAGILLHQILLQDFTNHQAWLLLHGMRGEGQTLEDFQHSFAAKYYPQQAHLLTQSPESSPSAAQPSAPSPLPAIPSPLDGSQYCPVCGTALLPRAKFCVHCGAPLPQLSQPAGEAPELTPTSPAPLSPAPLPPLPSSPAANPPEPESLPLEPAAISSKPKPLPDELDILFKRAARQDPEGLALEAPAPEAEQEPETTERRPYCPTCHKTFPPEVLFCDTCRAPLFQMVSRLPTEPNQASEQTAGQLPSAAPSQASAAMPAAAPTPLSSRVQAPPGEGSLLIIRKKSPILEEMNFSLWIDGEYRDEIGSHQKRSYTLPAGTHTIEMVSEQHSSDPLTIEIPAKGTVRITCQPAGTSPEIIRPELKVIPTKAAKGTKTKGRRLPLGLMVLLLALLFLIFLVGIGMIALFLINQGVL